MSKVEKRIIKKRTENRNKLFKKVEEEAKKAKPGPKTNKDQTNIYLEGEIKKRVVKLSKTMGMSISSLCSLLILDSLVEYEKKFSIQTKMTL